MLGWDGVEIGRVLLGRRIIGGREDVRGGGGNHELGSEGTRGCLTGMGLWCRHVFGCVAFFLFEISILLYVLRIL